MQLKVQKIGDDFGIIFPQQLTMMLAITEGSLIDVEEQKGSLHLIPADGEIQRQVESFKQTEAMHRDTYRALAK